MQWRDGQVAFKRGVKVRAIAVVLGCTCAANPIHGFATRTGLCNDALSRVAAPQTRDTQGFDECQRLIGNVHVQQPWSPRNMTLCHHLLDQLTRFGGSRIEMAPALLHLRERHRGNAKQIPLHRRAHSSRVNGVVAHVGAIVDTGHHQVGFVIKQACQGNVHTVSRRSVHITKAVAGLTHVQRRMQGQCVGLGTVVLLRRHNFNATQVLERFVQGHNAGGLKAVVVGNQNIHDALGLHANCRFAQQQASRA